MMLRMSDRNEIRRGLSDAAPAALGLLPLGMAFGLLVVQTGFAWWWAPIFSVVIYAGSMEFLAVSMVTVGVGPVSAAVTGFMVNFRHLFYGLTFPRAGAADGARRVSSRLARAYSTYALTDESYAVVSALPRGARPQDYRPSSPRVLAIQALLQAGWVSGGIVGALAGQVIPDSVKGMEFALVALFVVLALDAFHNNRDFSLPLSAVAFAALGLLLSAQHMLMLALSAYFMLLLVRYAYPRLDDALRFGPARRDGAGWVES